ncbi:MULTISPECIES: type 1 glutamine amidotransferase domain-containing protein [Enterococcus]|uniref:type 1 glutamine amidotransferase domain-containing protein n=1 Tax=Enterococcus TaxID=1350 RepID=UPI001A967738|nr:type 1 glutamine amidotransferase domain-containing protein [Enterococcus avium]MBO1138451.1 type 1 glutamine amidotransferase domain-containing protein [Enterococcus avium]MDT2479388.1 type 1 glutamine amidotransferase domain-containing protein [Enterococcus avium]MDT2493054.1 type 1 glutamine amidotransferase domain-containing protein [Enterococcus avium]
MKKVLIVETNVQKYAGTDEPTGLWLGESVEFISELYKQKIDVDFVSPQGGFVPLDPRSMKYTNADIMNVYLDKEFIREGLVNTKKPEDIDPEKYNAIYYTGGHGVMWDFPDNKELQEIALAIYENNGYILSVCHGIAGLLNIKDKEGNFLISDKKITGFTKAEERLAGKTRVVPFFNQEEAKKRKAFFQKKRFYKEFAIKDGRIITGQNPFSVRAVAKLYLEELEACKQS